MSWKLNIYEAPCVREKKTYFCEYESQRHIPASAFVQSSKRHSYSLISWYNCYICCAQIIKIQFGLLAHSCRMHFPSVCIGWSQFQFKRCWVVLFSSDSNFKENFVSNHWRLWSDAVLRRLIWVCIICICPIKRTLRLYGLRRVDRYLSSTQSNFIVNIYSNVKLL